MSGARLNVLFSVAAEPGGERVVFSDPLWRLRGRAHAWGLVPVSVLRQSNPLLLHGPPPHAEGDPEDLQ